MQSDEKRIREQNLRDLQTAQQLLLGRSKSQRSCFETLLNLNKAAITMCLGHEVDEGELAALAEVLGIQHLLIESAYAHFRLNGDNFTTKQS